MASPHESAHQARTGRHRPGPSTVGVEVAEGIFTAGLALEDAAAVAADPLVRGRIEKAISALDDVVRGAAFGTEDDGGFPGSSPWPGTSTTGACGTGSVRASRLWTSPPRPCPGRASLSRAGRTGLAATLVCSAASWPSCARR